MNYNKKSILNLNFINTDLKNHRKINKSLIIALSII